MQKTQAWPILLDLFETRRVVSIRTGQMGKRQVMNLDNCDVIFDDNQSICQKIHIGQKRVYCITTKWEKHEWAKDYRQSECPPLVFRTFALAVKHFLPLPKDERQWPLPVEEEVFQQFR